MQRPEGGGGNWGRPDSFLLFRPRCPIRPCTLAREGRVAVPGDVDGKLDKEKAAKSKVLNVCCPLQGNEKTYVYKYCPYICDCGQDPMAENDDSF